MRIDFSRGGPFKNKLFLRAARKAFPRLGLRSTDIILATFPKSGTTWLRFIFANIVSILYLDERIVDFHLLNGGLRGALDSFVFPADWPDDFPRILASHRIYKENLFKKNNCIYLYRHPGDVMVSYYEHRKALKNEHRYNEDFKTFIRDDRFGIPAWCRHYSSWRNRATETLSYEEITGQPFETLERILVCLELKRLVPDGVLRKAIERSQFENVRRIENSKGLDKRATKRLEPGFRFARKGKVGEWTNYFDNQDLQFMLGKVGEVKDIEGLTKAF